MNWPELTRATRGALLFMIWRRIIVLGGAISCDLLIRSSSVETMITEDFDGLVAWEGMDWFQCSE